MQTTAFLQTGEIFDYALEAREMSLLVRRVFTRIPTKVILDGLKRNMSRGNSLSDELELSSVIGDTRAYLYSPVLG